MALTNNINVAEKSDPLFNTAPVATAAHLFMGGMIARNAYGFAVPAADAADLKVIGIAEQEVDNAAGQNGDRTVVAKLAPRWIDNSSVEPLTEADMGGTCYVEDDATVAKQTVHGIPAGIARQLSEDGSKVLVDFFVAPILAASPEPSSSEPGSSEVSSQSSEVSSEPPSSEPASSEAPSSEPASSEPASSVAPSSEPPSSEPASSAPASSE